MRLVDWLTIVAILIGPLSALLIQKWIERRQAREDRKVSIFRTLMANRASRLSQDYVKAFNGIATEFYGDTNVIEAWRALNDHLNSSRDAGGGVVWDNRLNQLLVDMLYEMAETLDYHFDKVTLMRAVYHPLGWNTLEVEQTKLRQAAVAVFEGEKTLKVEIANPQG
jgi:hypothetical protein